MNLRSLLCVLACGALAACGASASPGAQPSAAAAAYVRLVDASPDIETVNPQLPPGAASCNFQSTQPSFGGLISVQLNGVTAVASFPYGTVSQFIAVPSGTPVAVSVVYPGSAQNGCPSLNYTMSSLKAGAYVTVAVGGQYQKKTLQFFAFNDAAPSSSPAATIYNASPASGSIGVGTFTPGQTNFTVAGTLAVGQTASLAVSSQAPGTGYFAGSAANAVTLTPAAVNSFDSTNAVPFNSYQQLSVFIMDGTAPPAPQLAGGFY